MEKIVLTVITILVLLTGCNENSELTVSGLINSPPESAAMETSKPSESSTFGECINDSTLAKESATSVGGSVEDTDSETSQNNECLVTFKITDSNGSGIPKVYIKIDPGTPTQRTTRYSDQNGVITYSFSKFGLGKYSIVIVEGYKIKKEIQYEINIEKFPAEVNLIWDFGNPDKIEYTPESTATLYFHYDDGKPVTGYLVCAAYNTSDGGVNVGFDLLAEVGTLNDQGIVVWTDPPKNAEVELQIIDKDENLRIYDITTFSYSGNTDYHFSWGNDSIKH